MTRLGLDLLFRLALRALPGELRRRCGADMLELFRMRRAAHGRRSAGAALRYGAIAILDLLGTAVRERGRGWMPTTDGRSRTTTGRGWGGEGMTEWTTDLGRAVRNLMRAPGFTIAAVAILALGIGANGAVFSVLRQTAFAELPWESPDRLVLLDLVESETARPVGWSWAKWTVLRDADDAPAERMAGYAVRQLSLTGVGDAARLDAEIVTPGYLEVLGVRPALGSGFGVGQGADGDAPMAAILSHGLWRRTFGGDPEVVGRTVRLNGQAVTVVGVGPEGFAGLSGRASLWVPARAGAQLISPVLLRATQAHWMQVVARLPENSSVATARARMAAIGARVQEAYPDEGEHAIAMGGGARSLAEASTNPDARRASWILAGAALLVLVIAVANLAGLLLARASARGRDTSVRLALGGGRWRVMRGVMAEALVLSVGGGLVGVVLASFGTDALVRFWPDRFLDGGWNLRFVDPSTFRMDPGAVGFAFGLAVVAGLFFGALPAWRISRRDPAVGLRGSRTTVPGGTRWDLRSALVVGEIALALTLLVGAGLLIRSFQALEAVDRGFDSEGVLTFRVSLPRGSSWAEDPGAFIARFTERAASLPGVEAVGTGCVPLSGHCWISGVRSIDGAELSGESRAVGVQIVDTGWPEVLSVEPIHGRWFSRGLGPGDDAEFVLTESAARTLFGDEDPIGRRVAIGIELTSEGREAEVVGVVPDILFGSPEEGVMPEVFVPVSQMPATDVFSVRASGAPLALLPELRRAVAELDPSLPVHDVRTLESLDRGTTADTRVLMGLLTLFALVALGLASTGIWGVVAFAVAQRRRELGVRIALGAESGRVVGLLLRRGALLAAVGVAIGGVGAWWVGGLVASLLYETPARDPLAFSGAALTLGAVAIAATLLPALSATKVDPVEAMRAD